MTAVSPERAVYERFRKAFPSEDWGPWELLSAEDREGWQQVEGGGASPDLARARDQLAAVKDLATTAERAPVLPRKRFTYAAHVAFARRILAVLDSKPGPRDD